LDYELKKKGMKSVTDLKTALDYQISRQQFDMGCNFKPCISCSFQQWYSHKTINLWTPAVDCWYDKNIFEVSTVIFI